MDKSLKKNEKNKYVKEANIIKCLSEFLCSIKEFLLKGSKSINDISNTVINKRNILLILSIIFVYILMNVVVHFEIKFKLYVKFEKVIELCAMAIAYAGILIGLHYTNYNTLITNRYNNASPVILKKLNSLPIFVNAVKNIIFYIEIVVSYVAIYILNYVRVGNTDVSDKIGFLSCIFIVVGILSITFRYKIISNELIEYNNQFKLSEEFLTAILIELRLLPRGYVNLIGLKNEIYTEAQRKVNDSIIEIRSIISDNLKCNMSNETFVKEMVILYNTVFHYFGYKRQIQYNSEWFPKSDINLKYYDADFITYDIANKTGTLPLKKKAIEYNWFENLMLDGVYDMYSRLLNDEDFNSIVKFLCLLNEKLPPYCLVGEGKIIFEAIKKQFDKFASKLSTSTNNSEIIESIYDKFAVNLEELALMIKKSILIVDYKIINESVIIIKNQEKNVLNNFINTPECYKLYLSCKIENKNEGNIITTDKFILTIIIDSINSYFDSVIKFVTSIFEYLYSVAKNERDANRINTALILYYVCINFIIRFRNIDDMVLERMEAIYNYYSIENNYNIDNKFEEIVAKEFGNVIKEFGDIMLCNNQDQLSFEIENDPDFYGYYINESVKYMLDCIKNKSYDEFEKLYKKYIYKVLLYQEKIRADVTDKNYNDSFVVKVVIEPFIKYCQLSGVAMIYGILIDDRKWMTLVYNEFEEFCSSKISEEKISLMLKCIEVYRKLFVYNINDSSINRFCTDLVNNNISQYIVSKGIYGDEYKTKDDLLNKFLNNKYSYKMILNSIEEFYIVKVINAKLNNENKYKSISGWEDHDSN